MLIEARNVTKAFGAFKAVDDASVSVEEGDVLGLIGPLATLLLRALKRKNEKAIGDQPSRPTFTTGMFSAQSAIVVIVRASGRSNVLLRSAAMAAP